MNGLPNVSGVLWFLLLHCGNGREPPEKRRILPKSNANRPPFIPKTPAML